MAEVKDELNKLASLDTKLTPPDILIASDSARLTINDKRLTISEATVSGMLAAYDLNISNSLKSLGQTTLAKTAVNGDLTIDGTLSIENGNEINVIGTLYLQKSILAQNLDIFGGKVIVDSSGNITTSGEVKAASITTNKLTISNSPIASSSASISPTIGTGTIPARQTSVIVNTSQVSLNVKIFVTPRTKIGNQSLVVDQVINGSSFTVTLDHSLSEDVKFDWWIEQPE